MDVATWIDTHIVRRVLPVNRSSGFVVLKLDIEGSDEGVLAALMSREVLCAIDYVYTEAHVRPEVVTYLNARLKALHCKTHIEFMDDEEYHSEPWTQPVL